MDTREQRLLVLVLGMHRSGTSVMARGLAALGIRLGDRLIPAHPCNPKGFFEDMDINVRNDLLLRALGAGWEHPVSLREFQGTLRRFATSDYGQAALALLLNKMQAADGAAAEGGRPRPAPLAFKEPRMSRLMTFWRPLFLAAGCAPHVCLALRHPAHVAASLTARNGFPAAQGWRLWLHYTLDALEGSLGLPALVVEYDALLAAPEAQMRRIAHWLGLTADEDGLRVFCDSFLDRSLCHHGASAAPAPETDDHAPADAGRPEDILPAERDILLAEELYQYLRAAARHGEDLTAPALARRLSRWRAALDALPPSPMVTARSPVSGGK